MTDFNRFVPPSFENAFPVKEVVGGTYDPKQYISETNPFPVMTVVASSFDSGSAVSSTNPFPTQTVVGPTYSRFLDISQTNPVPVVYVVGQTYDPKQPVSMTNPLPCSSTTEEVETDPSFASVVLLVGNDSAADTTTTFVDQSASAKTATVNGNTQYDTAQAPTGLTSSIQFDGTGDFLTWANEADFIFGTGDFTVEGFIRRTNDGTTEFLSKNAGGTRSWGLYFVAGGGASVFIVGDLSTDQTIGTLAVDTWHHFALCRTGNTWYTFLDGGQNDTWTDAVDMTDATAPFGIGAKSSNGLSPLTGHMASVRVTKGVARYTGTFTPPTLPLPTS